MTTVGEDPSRREQERPNGHVQTRIGRHSKPPERLGISARQLMTRQDLPDSKRSDMYKRKKQFNYQPRNLVNPRSPRWIPH